MTTTTREPLAPLAVNVLSNHAPLKLKVPKRKLSTCSIGTNEAEVPFSVYSCEFPLMPNSRNSTLYSPNSTSKYEDFEEPPFPSTKEPYSPHFPPTKDRNSPPLSPPIHTENVDSDKLRKTKRLPARRPMRVTSPTSPISPQFHYQLHTGPTPRTVSDVTGLTRSRSSSRVQPAPITPPSGQVNVTRKRSRERNALVGQENTAPKNERYTTVVQENPQREDGYSRKFTQARILSDLTHNRGRNASSPRSQYAVFRAEAERVRGLTDLGASAAAKQRNNSSYSMYANSPPPSSTIELDQSQSFTITTNNPRIINKRNLYSVSSKKSARHNDRAEGRFPRNLSQPPARVIIRGGPRPAFSQRATSEMVRRRPSARGRTRSEVEAPMAGNVQLNELRDQVDRGLRQRRVWMLRGKVFKRWQKVHARIEDCSTLVLMRNGIIKHYRLRCAFANAAPDVRTLKMKGGTRLTVFKVHLDNDKVLTFATEYATEANSWIDNIQRVGDPNRNPIWDHLP